VTARKEPPDAKAQAPRRGYRRRGRVACLRGLYRSEVVRDDLREVREELASGDALPDDVRDYAVRLMDLVADHAAEIDRILRDALTRWDLDRLAITDRCVLRLGAAELLYEPDVPARVVLDEAIEIAKRYGSGESGRFVNGVLDHIAREHRGEDEL
jgi:N utilization substance protein B